MNKRYTTKQELYEKLEDFYMNNSVYEEVLESATVQDINTVNFHYAKKDGMRNPTNRAVEFYTSKVIPGDLENIKIQAENDALIEAINQVFIWSNFANNKQRDIRHLALFGNLFYKANADGSKVWFDIIDSKNVTSFKADSRGYLVEIRIDTPVKNDFGNLENRVEYWNKAKNEWKIWQGNTNSETPIKQLGTPEQFGTISSLGIDFIPIVHTKFKDVGYPEGVSSVYHVLSKIEEANKQAKRLHEILFRYGKPTTIVSSNAEGKNGEPLPAPLIGDTNYIGGDTDLLVLPGNVTVHSVIPNIDYNSVLAVLNAQLKEIESDLPELKYYELTDNNVSGKSLKLQMSSAVDRAEEARGNFVSGLIRIVQVCLSLGSFWGLFSVGSYEKGELDFSVDLPEMFPMDDNDKAELLAKLTQAEIPFVTRLRMVGYSEDFIAQALEAKSAEDSVNEAIKAKSQVTAFNQL